MQHYTEYTLEQLQAEDARLKKEYEEVKAKGIKLDLSRGKPDSVQLDLSRGMLDCLDSGSSLRAEDGTDCVNYGALAGIPEARRFMADIMDVAPEEVFIGGNSSLNLMHDCMGIAYLFGMVGSETPWSKLPAVKFLCPSPGYDRHFAVSQHFGAELVTVPMTKDGPDMDVVERLVAGDSAIKGIWCVPKYSNPTGITYSDETVRRLASMPTAAPDFTIFWDNAYACHDFYPDEPDVLLNIMEECKKNDTANRLLIFASTSKISFSGAGISAFAAAAESMKHLQKQYSLQTIGYDKLNQLRHVRFFQGENSLKNHMRKHAALLLPKFNAVLDCLRTQLGDLGIARWETPRGGYFISLDTPEGCAKRAVALCAEAGVVITPAGATFPYGADPADSNIRIAPTFAAIDEVGTAAALLCLCVKMASVEKLLAGRLDSRAS